MFHKRTVFVLGAGSSQEVGLPVGWELKIKIAQKLKVVSDDYNRRTFLDRDLGQEIRKKVNFDNNGDSSIFNQTFNEYINAANTLVGALSHATSIDELLHAHNENEYMELCGKLAITKIILDAEKSSALFYARGSKFKNPENTWFDKFFKAVHTNIIKDNVQNIFQNISIINFNYDRCIEHFLYEALKAYYDLTDEQAAELLKGLKIFHPYGQVGRLPWQVRQNPEAVPYGFELSRQAIFEISEQIKTFNESKHDEREIKEIHNAMEQAETIVFLGFAFHKQNIKLISPKSFAHHRAIYATRLGLSDNDVDVIKQDLERHIPYTAGAKFAESCSDLFGEYSRSLTVET